MSISKELLEVLACPACKSDVIYDETKRQIICVNSQCNKRYPVKDGIPIMMVEESVVE
jgi:uncharacterized protein